MNAIHSCIIIGIVATAFALPTTLWSQSPAKTAIDFSAVPKERIAKPDPSKHPHPIGKESIRGGAEAEITIANPPAGLYYASVVGKDTVDAKTGSPFVYSGKTGVLNGVAYSIRADINL